MIAPNHDIFEYEQSPVPETPEQEFQQRMQWVMRSVAERTQINRRLLITDDGDFTSDEREALLDAHNDYRSETALGTTSGDSGNLPSAMNMNSLFWDPCLEKVATDYAATCPSGHNSNSATDTISCSSIAKFTVPSSLSYIGENIYYSSVKATAISQLTSGVDGWFEEAAFYEYGQLYVSGCSSVSDPMSCSTDSCLHYTQVVWADTRYVGCGYKYCTSGWALFFVCNYYPPGNWCGQYPYESGTSCSSCDGDRDGVCDEGLCSGGMNSDWESSGSSTTDDCYDGTDGTNTGGRYVCSSPTTSTTTPAPVPTTAAPVPTTAAPIPTTAAPVPTTAAPVPTTAASVPTTAAPVPTTAAPVPTTAAVPTTAIPTTATPTTAAPVPTLSPPTPAPTTYSCDDRNCNRWLTLIAYFGYSFTTSSTTDTDISFVLPVLQAFYIQLLDNYYPDIQIEFTVTVTIEDSGYDGYGYFVVKTVGWSDNRADFYSFYNSMSSSYDDNELYQEFEANITPLITDSESFTTEESEQLTELGFEMSAVTASSFDSLSSSALEVPDSDEDTNDDSNAFAYNTTTIVIAGGFAAVLFAICLCGCVWYYRRSKRREESHRKSSGILVQVTTCNVVEENDGEFAEEDEEFDECSPRSTVASPQFDTKGNILASVSIHDRIFSNKQKKAELKAKNATDLALSAVFQKHTTTYVMSMKGDGGGSGSGSDGETMYGSNNNAIAIAAFDDDDENEEEVEVVRDSYNYRAPVSAAVAVVEHKEQRIVDNTVNNFDDNFGEEEKKVDVQNVPAIVKKKRRAPPPPKRTAIEKEKVRVKPEVKVIKFTEKIEMKAKVKVDANPEVKKAKVVENVRIYTYDELVAGAEIKNAKREMLMSDSEFELVFGMNKETFGALKGWKMTLLKKNKGLF